MKESIIRWGYMRWLCAILLAALISLAHPQTVEAFMDETVSNGIVVPGNLLWDIQGDMQGYIMYKVEETPTGYSATIARDGEPHQFPIFIYNYDENWNLLNKANVQPKVETPIPKAQPEPVPIPSVEVPKPVPAPPTPEPEKPDKPEKPPKPDEPIIIPDPPVVKPPEEELEPQEPPVQPEPNPV